MPNEEKQGKPTLAELAGTLNERLEELASPGGRPDGWATQSEHYQNYAYLVAILESLEKALGGSTTPGEFRRGWPDGRVMLLAQQLMLKIDQAPPGPISDGDRAIAVKLLASVRKALKAVATQPQS